MGARSFRIRLDVMGRGSVEIDGVPQTGIVAVAVDSELGEVPQVTVTYLASSVDLEVADNGETN